MGRWRFSAEIRRYLDEVKIPLRLACLTPSGGPLVLSLWYIRLGDELYCATQSTSRVAEYLRQEPRCAYEVAADLPPYCGVRGQGLATIQDERGPEILERLLDRYIGGRDTSLGSDLLSRAESEVAVCIETVSQFQWNYSDRMRDSFSNITPKPCPS